MKRLLAKSLLGISAFSLLTTSFTMSTQAATHELDNVPVISVETVEDSKIEVAEFNQVERFAFPLAIPVIIWGARGAQVVHKVWKAGKLVTIGSAVGISGMKAQDVIGKYKKGAINKEFPGSMKNKTVKEIEDLAKKGNKDAKKAKKLLTDKRFNKGDNRK
ncbi:MULTISPECIES: hypothetical protein [unclassified Bacillus (in: firmicutes)]|uniref:hypothetical protein n=1 Tax=Bacillus TaxID=1386 RepID=UPI001C9B60A8|nr:MULTISPECIES: hypothetical protein [unclassified Bacillus (in: firmicutes)]MBY7125045.1 hypothetical protein [Bacillus sp. 16GRE42]MCR6849994.1 hypothetical protein [Bacillus sp. IBL03825]HDR7785140.1 hypothetical protein [Bacillus wiedmannii]